MSDQPADLPLERPELVQQVKILEALQRGQEPLWNDPARGLASGSEAQLSSLQEKSLKQNIPISHILDESSYSLDKLRQALATLIYEVNELGVDPDMDPLSLVKQLDGVLQEIIGSALRGRMDLFAALAERIKASPVVLALVGDALIQPSMIHLASLSKRNYLDAWELTVCPVCGRHPSVAIKVETEAWRFICSYCQAEYRMDIFSCPHCKAEGFENKEFLLVGESQAHEVAACSECNRYYKIINTQKLRETIPRGLEHIYTAFLDEIAHERGLRRLDESGPEN